MIDVRARLKTAMRRAVRLVPRRPRPAILMYHRIGREAFDPWGLVVELPRFARQIEWLAKNRIVLPLSEFARHQQERKLPPEAVALTFDDGYASVLNAVPLIEKHGLHATVFLPIKLIERGGFWWDELPELVVGWRGDTLLLDGERRAVPRADERDRRWPPDTRPRTPRQKLFQSLWSNLHAMRPSALDAAMTQLRSQAANEPEVTDSPLTPEQVRSVKPSTIDFGSHGLSHPSLPRLSADEKQREIAESRVQCEALTGSAPAAFAYPFGDVDEVSVRLVEQAGYTCACATGDTFVRNRSPRFALPRLRVGNWEVGGLRDMLGT